MPAMTTIPAEIQAQSILRMAAYCRVSSNSADQLNSYAMQVRHYTDHVSAHPGWILVDIYADKLTGTEAETREEFQRMLADCKRGKIDRILVKSVSRFARNTSDCLTVIRLLKSLGVTVLFEKENLDTANMKGEFELTMHGMAAQGESMGISGNLRWRYQKRMRAGEFLTCSAPFGYRLVGSSALEIVPEEAEIVRRIFTMHLAGLGRQKICGVLNAGQAGGRKWDSNSLKYILASEKYVGDSLVQKTYTTNTLPFRARRNNGERPQWYIQRSHPAIIDKATYEAARRLQEGRRSAHQHKPYPLTGKLRCPDCGGTFRRQVINGKPRWTCAASLKGQTHCTPIRLGESSVHEVFLLLVNKLISHREYILVPLIRQMETMQSKANGTQQKVYQIDQQVAGLTAQCHALAQLHSKGILAPAAFTAQTAKLNGQLTQLRNERRAALHVNDSDDQLNELRTLNDRLTGLEFQDEFDGDLFRDVVQSIVSSPTELRFTLPGGLTLTEAMPSIERRWNR